MAVDPENELGRMWANPLASGGRRGNPYHVPKGSSQGGQFTHGPVAAVKNATEHVNTTGHGAADTRKHVKPDPFLDFKSTTNRDNARALAPTIAKIRSGGVRWPVGVAPPTGNAAGARRLRGH